MFCLHSTSVQRRSSLISHVDIFGWDGMIGNTAHTVGGVQCSGEVDESQLETDNYTDHQNDRCSDHRQLDTDAMLDYIERFHELLDRKDYHSAAMHAANSPQGILRTVETLHRLAGMISTIYNV